MSTPNIEIFEKNVINYHDDFLSGETGFSEHGSHKRYHEILEIIDPKKSILEIGCGPTAGILPYIKLHECAKYCGIDINPKYIDASQKHYVNKNLFQCKNILYPNGLGTYDNVIASGIFCYDYEDATEINKRILSKMLLHANECVVANFIPTTAPNPEKVKENKILQYSPLMLGELIESVDPDYFGFGYRIISDRYKNNTTLIFQRHSLA